MQDNALNGGGGGSIGNISSVFELGNWCISFVDTMTAMQWSNRDVIYCSHREGNGRKGRVLQSDRIKTMLWTQKLLSGICTIVKDILFSIRSASIRFAILQWTTWLVANTR